jgi:hypothetical protein
MSMKKWNVSPIFPVGVGLLLCAAGVAKSVWPDPNLAAASRAEIFLSLAIVQLEIFLGLWLIFGIWTAWACRVALASFVAFGGYSLWKALSGAETCGCFGAAVNTSPWLSFAIDAAVVMLLVTQWPALTSAPLITFRASGTSESYGMAGSRSSGMVSFLAVAVCFSGGYWFRAVRQLYETPNAGLVVSRDALDFGEQWVQNALLWKIAIHNPTARDIEVTNLRASCTCASLAPRQFVVPAGATVDVEATLDLTTRDPKLVELPRRQFVAEFFPEFVAATPPTRQVPWRVVGTVRSAVLIRHTLQFEEGSLIRGDRFISKTIDVSCHEELSRLDVHCDSTYARAVVERLAHARRKFLLRVTPNEQLPAAWHEFDLSVTPTTQGGQRLPPLTVRTIVPVVHDVRALPSLVSLGVVRVGEPVTGAVVLQSRKRLPFNVAHIPSGKTPVHVQSNETASVNQFKITVIPGESGLGKAVVRLRVDQENEPPYEVLVTLSYFAEEKRRGS